MSDSNINDDWLAFSSRIEVILSVEKDCLHVIIIDKNMLQHVLFMQFYKSDDNDVILIDLTNMIEFRSVISSVTQFVKLTKWH